MINGDDKMLCSNCNENVAVIFVNKMEDGKMKTEGLCIPCAKKKGIAPMDQIIQQTGMNPDDFENINEQLQEVLGDIDMDELTHNIQEGESGGKNPFSNLLNSSFSNISKNKDNKYSEYQVPERTPLKQRRIFKGIKGDITYHQEC